MLMSAKDVAEELREVIGYSINRIGPRNVRRLRWWVDQLIAAERRRAVKLLRKEWSTLADKDAAWASKLAKLLRNG